MDETCPHLNFRSLLFDLGFDLFVGGLRNDLTTNQIRFCAFRRSEE